jgi:hypothetical protein
MGDVEGKNMEGGQNVPQSEGPVVSSTTRIPKKRLAIIVAVIVVVMVAIAVIVVANPSLLGGSSTGGGDMFKDPHVGDYITYAGAMGMTMKIEVTQVTATDVTILQNTTMSFGGQEISVPVYQTVSKEEAFRAGDYDPYKAAPGWSVNNMGKKLISTPYGARNCDHFALSNTTQGIGATEDIYLFKGILVKVDITYAGMMTMPILSLSATNLSIIVQG